MNVLLLQFIPPQILLHQKEICDIRFQLLPKLILAIEIINLNLELKNRIMLCIQEKKPLF